MTEVFFLVEKLVMQAFNFYLILSVQYLLLGLGTLASTLLLFQLIAYRNWLGTNEGSLARYSIAFQNLQMNIAGNNISIGCHTQGVMYMHVIDPNLDQLICSYLGSRSAVVYCLSTKQLVSMATVELT
jgi:hypothetical protein